MLMESCLQLYHSHLVALTVSDPASSSDSVDVDVIIDGKFEHGYIVTVIMGSKSAGRLDPVANLAASPPPPGGLGALAGRRMVHRQRGRKG